MTDRGNQCTARLPLSPPILFSCITGLSPSLPIQPLRFAAWLILSLAFHPSLHVSTPHFISLSIPQTLLPLRLHFTVIPHFGCCSLQSPTAHFAYHSELYLRVMFYKKDLLRLQIGHIKGTFNLKPLPNCGESLKYMILIYLRVPLLVYCVGLLIRYWKLTVLI